MNYGFLMVNGIRNGLTHEYIELNIQKERI
jgi:uncharacterized protein YutE (UPF0331/DUF86 family)